jgi:hypothetical protein
MFRCLDCKAAFDEPLHLVETHGLDTPPFEDRYVCPRCKSGHYKPFVQDEFSRRQIIKDLLEIMADLNEFNSVVSDAFNSNALEDTAFDCARGNLYELLTVISADTEFDLPNNIDDWIFKMKSEAAKQKVYATLVENIEEE